jgi:hypothetical protein
MTQALTGIVLAGVVAACWVLGRPKRNILRSTDASAIAAINRSQMELVIPAGAGAAKEQTSGLTVQLPAAHDRRGRGQLLKQLEGQFRAGGEARRSAMAVCQLWRHHEALPLIRRGLRDADPVVAALAADAMTHFRGRSSAPVAAAQPLKLPRNVSRMR